MPRFQLVLQNAEGDIEDTLLIDNPGAKRPIAYHGQVLKQGSVISMPGEQMYVVIDFSQQDGLPRYTCRALAS